MSDGTLRSGASNPSGGDTRDESAPFAETMAALEERLLAAERGLPAPTLDRVRELVGTVLDLHRAGLSALVQALSASDEGARLLGAAAEVEPVLSLLVLHELHPVPLEERIREAVRFADREAGRTGSIELVKREGARVRIRVSGRDAGACASMEAAMDSAMGRWAPEAEIVVERATAPAPNLIPIERLRVGGGGRR